MPARVVELHAMRELRCGDNILPGAVLGEGTGITDAAAQRAARHAARDEADAQIAAAQARVAQCPGPCRAAPRTRVDGPHTLLISSHRLGTRDFVAYFRARWKVTLVCR